MECSICLEPFNEPEFCKYTCHHGSFHKNCISKCPRCPLCRADVKVKNRRILINNILFTDYFDIDEQQKMAS